MGKKRDPAISSSKLNTCYDFYCFHYYITLVAQLFNGKQNSFLLLWQPIYKFCTSVSEVLIAPILNAWTFTVHYYILSCFFYFSDYQSWHQAQMNKPHFFLLLQHYWQYHFVRQIQRDLLSKAPQLAGSAHSSVIFTLYTHTIICAPHTTLTLTNEFHSGW